MNLVDKDVVRSVQVNPGLLHNRLGISSRFHLVPEANETDLKREPAVTHRP